MQDNRRTGNTVFYEAARHPHIMNSMAAYMTDLSRQVVAAEGFSGPPPLSKTELANAIFTGSGDSLAAAMLAEALSGYTARAADPLELYRNPSMIADRTLYIVSISGRTITNIRLAESHPSTAITANPDSRLARAAGRTIHLDFPNSDTLTAGSISFLNSALVCMSLVRPIRTDDIGTIFEKARDDAASTPISGATPLLRGRPALVPGGHVRGRQGLRDAGDGRPLLQDRAVRPHGALCGQDRGTASS